MSLVQIAAITLIMLSAFVNNLNCLLLFREIQEDEKVEQAFQDGK